MISSSTSAGATDKMAAVKGARGFSPCAGVCSFWTGRSEDDPVNCPDDKSCGGFGFGFVVVALGSLDDAAFGSYTMIRVSSSAKSLLDCTGGSSAAVGLLAFPRMAGEGLPLMFAGAAFMGK